MNKLSKRVKYKINSKEKQIIILIIIILQNQLIMVSEGLPMIHQVKK
jgi:hypothetical protein